MGTQSGDPSKLRDPEEVYKATLQPLQVSLLLDGVVLAGGQLAKSCSQCVEISRPVQSEQPCCGCAFRCCQAACSL